METTIQQSGNQIIASFSGRLDTAAAVPAAEAVKPLLEAENSEIILDAPTSSISPRRACVSSSPFGRKRLRTAPK